MFPLHKQPINTYTGYKKLNISPSNNITQVELMFVTCENGHDYYIKLMKLSHCEWYFTNTKTTMPTGGQPCQQGDNHGQPCQQGDNHANICCSCSFKVKWKMTDSRIFWTLDFFSEYFQKPMAEESRNYTAFLTPFCIYEHWLLPHGYAVLGDRFIMNTDPLVRGVPQGIKSVHDISRQSTSFQIC